MTEKPHPELIGEIEELLFQSNHHINGIDWSDPKPFNPRKLRTDTLKWAGITAGIAGVTAFAVSHPRVAKTALVLAGATLTLRATRSVLQAIDSCGHH